MRIRPLETKNVPGACGGDSSVPEWQFLAHGRNDELIVADHTIEDLAPERLKTLIGCLADFTTEFDLRKGHQHALVAMRTGHMSGYGLAVHREIALADAALNQDFTAHSWARRSLIRDGLPSRQRQARFTACQPQSASGDRPARLRNLAEARLTAAWQP